MCDVKNIPVRVYSEDHWVKWSSLCAAPPGGRGRNVSGKRKSKEQKRARGVGREKGASFEVKGGVQREKIGTTHMCREGGKMEGINNKPQDQEALGRHNKVLDMLWRI